jgi:hypothetical protein
MHFRVRALNVMELTIAIAVLAVLLAAALKMIVSVSQQIRANDRRNVALQSLQAVAEEIENLPWNELTQQTAAQVDIPAAAARYLPDAKLSVSVADETDPTAKRIRVELTWKGRGNQAAAPVGLTIWVFPETASQPPAELENAKDSNP